MNENMYPIGVVANETGMTLRALRFYEQKKLVKPRRVGVTGKGSSRLYTETDVRDLKVVARYTDMGFTLAEIATMLESYSFDELDKPAAIWVASALNTKIKAKYAELEVKKKEIEAQMKALAQAQWALDI